MPGPNRFILTRRQALQGLGLATIYLSSGAFVSPDPAWANGASDPSSTTLAVSRSITARSFSEDWSTRFDVDFPVEIHLEASSDKDAVPVVIEWDDRLFDVTPTVIAYRDGGFEQAEVTGFDSGRMSFTVPAGATAFYMQPRLREVYPHENLGAPSATGLRTSNSDDTHSTYQEAAAAPWGLELRTVWAKFEGYSYPAAVELLSVGPHAVPAGVAVIARTYRSVPPLTVDIDGNQVSADPETPQNRMIDRVFNLNAMLPAGETILISLTPEESDTTTSKPSISQVGQVFALIPDDAAVEARATGRLSVAAVTSSGTELTDSSASRKA